MKGHIRRSRVICWIPFLGKGSNHVAEVAGDAGVPVVAVDGPPHEFLIRHVAAVAGMVCTRTPGASYVPGYAKTLEFMRLRKAAHSSAGQYCLT